MAESAETPLSILVCGIPASGKSTFGRWLHETHGFGFVELEARPDAQTSLDQNGLRDAWEQFWTGQDLRDFPAALLRFESGVVLEWGFPINLIHVVHAFRQAGIVPWWFDGDRLAARELFIRRDERPPELFDRQFAAISAAWCAIAPVFADRIIRVVHPDGSLEPPSAVLATIAAQPNSP